MTRRWYQFSLRTLLIGVALLGVACAYVAHEARIVAARKAWIASHALPSPGIGSHYFDVIAPGDRKQAPSVLRKWLGDFDCIQWEVLSSISPKELHRAAAVLPEANIVVDGFRE